MWPSVRCKSSRFTCATFEEFEHCSVVRQIMTSFRPIIIDHWTNSAKEMLRLIMRDGNGSIGGETMKPPKNGLKKIFSLAVGTYLAPNE